MELFEQIRREYEFGIGTIAGVAKKLVDRSFYEDARNLPLIAPEKMIREERSTQDWSFSRPVWHRRGSVKVNHGR